jgi:PleD family two-component response regulator
MRKQILLVDDDPSSLEYFKYILKGHFSVDTAGSAEKALRKIQRHGQYNVVVTDYYMPGMDGAELLERVRDLSPESVRILFTGATKPEEIASGLEEGLVFGFIEKPIQPLNLIQFVRAALEHHQLLRAQQRREKVKAVLTNDELSFFKEKHQNEPEPEEEEPLIEEEPEHLTSFPGRRRFMDTLARMLAQAERSNSRIAVLYILLKSMDGSNGVDDAKTIKTLGRMAAKIEDRLRDSDFIVRIGPAEFAATLWNIENPKDITRICEDIMNILRSPAEDMPALGAGIGASIYPEDGGDPEKLLEKAISARHSPKALAC